MSDNNKYDEDSIINESAVYQARYIQEKLCLSKTKTYDYLKQVYNTQSPFRVIRIGSTFRIPKKEFNEWLYGKDDADA